MQQEKYEDIAEPLGALALAGIIGTVLYIAFFLSVAIGWHVL